MLRLSESADTWSCELVFETEPKDGLACEQQTPVFHDGLLYGIMPKDASALRGQFVCLATDGSLRWSSGKGERFGLGPFMIADGKMLILDDDGTLTMLRASRDKYIQLGQTRIIEGHDAWGPFALVPGARRPTCLPPI